MDDSKKLKLHAELRARGIRIGDDDPVFTLIAMNEIALGSIVETHQQALAAGVNSIKSAVDSLPALADSEMKRAGAQTIAELSDQVALIASRISNDSAQAERHKAFYLACGLLSVSSTAFAGLGVYVGSHDWGTAALFGTAMLTGVVAGMVLLTFLSGIEHEVASPTPRAPRTSPELPARQISEAQFTQAVTQLGKNTSSRTLAACKDVLVHGESSVDSGRKHDVLPAQITRITTELRAKIK